MAEQIDWKPKFAPIPEASKRAYVKKFSDYQKMHKESIEKNEQFWDKICKEYLTFFQPYSKVKQGTLSEGDLAWFTGGKLNACYNCLDRHLDTRGNQVALLWEGNMPDEIRKITYTQLFNEVCKCANYMKRIGVVKGSRICIYMPMIPELVVTVLACARLGAIHSVVFAGFSAEALRDRIEDSYCEFVFTANVGKRGDKLIKLKDVVDKSLEGINYVKKVVCYKHVDQETAWVEGRDVWWQEVMKDERGYCPCEWMDSEDTLFLLYTSGSTGKPKGVLHSTAGYLCYAAFTHKMVFDIHAGDVYACVADIGWITGHSYIVYGPLMNGATTFVFEGLPFHPNENRYWDMIQRHKINQFYTAPTAIRALIAKSSDPSKFDLKSLKVLGTVGEPINPSAWEWYFKKVGNSKVPIVDTFWQTETGGIVMTPLPGCTIMKPGSATFPFFGIDPVVVDLEAKDEVKIQTGNGVQGPLCIRKPWPGLARTVYGCHERYLNTYMRPYGGLYTTGDGCFRDPEGFYWITGRIDDVVNISGHRIGSAEVEHAIVSHESVAEAACIGIPHDLKGQVLFGYVILNGGVTESPELAKELKTKVREKVGALAIPETIVFTSSLPKTRSGKIMRRILRKIATNETESLGDISTLADSSVVDKLIENVKNLKK